MSYPYNQLADDEHVLEHQHPHWKMLIPRGLILVPTLAGCGYLALVAADHPQIRQVAWIALAIIAAAVSLWFGLLPWLQWKSTHFVVTTSKIMFREGIIARSGMNIPLARINSVRYEHDLNDRIFGCGSLIVESASDEPLTFDDIPAVEDVHTTLYQAVDGDTAALSTPR